VILVDIDFFISTINEIGSRLGIVLDDEEILGTILTSLEKKSKAIEELELRLLCVSNDFGLGDTLHWFSSDEHTYLLNECHSLGVRLFHQMNTLGLYKGDDLVFGYHSRTTPKLAAFVEKRKALTSDVVEEYRKSKPWNWTPNDTFVF